MNLRTTRAALGDALKSVAGFETHDVFPENVNPPAAIVGLGPGSYDSDFDGNLSVRFDVMVLVSRADAREAQEKLDACCDPTGSESFKAAVESDETLGGVIDHITCTGWDEPAVYDIGGISYVGVVFNCEAVG